MDEELEEKKEETKAGIEAILEKKIKDLEAREDERYADEIQFLNGLLQHFKDQANKVQNERRETYNAVLFQYILDSLPPSLTDEFIAARDRDDHRIREERKSKAAVMRQKKINDLEKRNANHTATKSYYRPDNVGRVEFFMQQIKKKTTVARQNKNQISRNKDRYAELIDWIEHYYVPQYSKRIGPTYYRNRTNDGYTGEITNPRENSEEWEAIYQKIEERVAEFYGKSPEEKKAEELLKYAVLDPTIQKELQKYLDYLKQLTKIKILLNCLSELAISKNYPELQKEKARIIESLKLEKERFTASVKGVKEAIQFDELYASKLEEIKKIQAKEEAPAVEEEKEEEYDEEVKQANEYWEARYIKNKVGRTLGRTPTEEDKVDDAYQAARKEAEDDLRKYLERLNKEFGDLLRRYLERELATFLTEKYGEISQKEMDYYIQDALMSPEARYIRDMIAAGRIPKNTRPEDLTSKDREAIEANKDKYFDDETDKRIQEFKKRLEAIQTTYFPKMYLISEMERVVAASKEEEKELEVAETFFTQK